MYVWRPVGKWSGRGTLQTEAFIGDTGSFRMQWETKNESAPGKGTFQAILHSAISGRPLLVGVDHVGVGKDMAYMQEDPRTFFIVFEAANLEWTASVDEAIPATVAPSKND